MTDVSEETGPGNEGEHADADVAFHASVEGGDAEGIEGEEEGVAGLFGGEDVVGGVSYGVETACYDRHGEELSLEVDIAGYFLHEVCLPCGA